MPRRLTPEERQVRNRYDRALTGLKNNITELSEQIASIEANLKTVQPVIRLYKRERITRVKIRVAFLQMKAAILELSLDPIDRNAEWTVLCRQIGNFIYDLTTIWTGYESEALLEFKKQYPRSTGSNEHFFPRQKAGKFIATKYLHNREMTFDRFCNLINRFRLTHRVTPAENSDLRGVQRKSESLFGWRKDYEQAGVVLRKPKTPRPILLTPSRRKLIGELLGALEYYRELKRAMVKERVDLNKRLKTRKQLYQLQVLGPSNMVAFGEEPLNTISVEGDDTIKYSSSHGQSEGTDREQKQTLEMNVQEANA